MNRCLFNGIHEIASLSSRKTRSLRAFFRARASTLPKMDFYSLVAGLANNVE